MATYKPSHVAEILGVSPDTVRRWCEEGKLDSFEASGRGRRIDGASLAEYLRSQNSAYEPDSVLQQSARNRFTGIITSVKCDELVAIVEIHAPPHRLVSMMTREAADELNLQAGDLATATVKSTNVTVELPRV